MKKNIEYLRKKILYRSTYSGTKESDYIYKICFIENLKIFSYDELKLIISLFKKYSDSDILLILSNKIKSEKKYSNLIKKITFLLK